MKKTKDLIQLTDDYVLNTYTRLPIVLVKGKGSKVWDADGNQYLDFFPGWAVSGLGHCPDLVVKAIQKQAKKILHVSNNYYNQLQGELAKKIIQYSFPGKVFFCNSGAEAIEGVIKLARAYGNPKQNEIISMTDSFHGRTLAAITATGQLKYQKGFEPLPAGFKHVEFNNLEAVKQALTDKTAAIILELIQGEGGINVASREFVVGLRNLCDEKNILLIFDEVQTCMGRTGDIFCFKNYGVEPDCFTLAKSLGGGVPIGAFVVKEKYAHVLKPGMHASTFGGGPLVCAAALATFKMIEDKNLLKNALDQGFYLYKRLNALKNKYRAIKKIRGMALMIGVELSKPGKHVVEECLKRKLLINCTHDKVLRIMPPLTVTKKEIDKAIKILDEALKVASSQ